MLQQTQVATVRSYYYYKEWLKRFPSFAALARASESEVLHGWQGLGYYARARNLHATARLVQDRYRGRFPRDLAAMRALPGIGKYTAHAVATFAFGHSVPIVEANTARVLARLFNLQSPIDSTRGGQLLWHHAAELMPKRHAPDFNSALVDLGALVCLPRKPKCPVCPVKRFCRATAPDSLPIRRGRPRTKRLLENHALVLNRDRILLEQTDRRWRGMWILPPLKLDRFNRSSSRPPVYRTVFPFTHHRITLQVFRRRPRAAADQSQRWFGIDQLDSIPVPSPHRRAFRSLLAGNVEG
jgi:A/G-specific adenine glycosylase